MKRINLIGKATAESWATGTKESLALLSKNIYCLNESKT